MSPLKYFLGRTLQAIGFLTITAVVGLFFTQMSMTPLLYLTLLGVVEFYGGTLLLEKNEG